MVRVISLRATTCIVYLPLTLGLSLTKRAFSLHSRVQSTIPHKAMTTAYPLCQQGVADLHFVPMMSDNYGYLVHETGSKEAFAVDPGDGKAILDAAATLGLTLTTVLCTHKHADHVGGNRDLKEAIPDINIIATKYEEIPHATRLVGDGEVFAFGRSLSIRTLYTPCHTAGHVLFFVTSTGSDDGSGRVPMLFSGDTLFVGGCGRFFEGTAEQMLTNMDKIATLPEETLVFCAHEYTESNFKFLADVDRALQGKYEEIQRIRAHREPTVPSTVKTEMENNLFMRCRDPQVQNLVGASNAVEAMQELRTRKNNFK